MQTFYDKHMVHYNNDRYQSLWFIFFEKTLMLYQNDSVSYHNFDPRDFVSQLANTWLCPIQGVILESIVYIEEKHIEEKHIEEQHIEEQHIEEQVERQLPEITSVTFFLSYDILPMNITICYNENYQTLVFITKHISN